MWNINGWNNADFLPEIWSKEAMNFMEKSQIIAWFVNRLDTDVISFGKSVKVPVIGDLVANDKTANKIIEIFYNYFFIFIFFKIKYI